MLSKFLNRYKNNSGKETISDVPKAAPLKMRRPANHWDDIRALIRQEMSEAASNQGMESFEDADDFDVGDDFDPTSPYELNFDPDFTDQSNVMKEEVPDGEQQSNNQTSVDSSSSTTENIQDPITKPQDN